VLGNSAFGIPGALGDVGHVELLVTDNEYPMPQTGHRRLHIGDAVDHQGAFASGLDGCLSQSVDVRVIPIESRRLVGWKLQAVLKSVTGIDQGLNHVITMTLGGGIGAVIVDVHRAAGHGKARGVCGTSRRRLKHRVAAGWCVEGLDCTHVGIRSVIGDSQVQGIARIHVQSWVLQAVGRHEAKELTAY